MSARAIVFAALACAGCTETRDVLSSALTDCTAALAATAGDACAFTGTCATTDAATCTSLAAQCVDQVLQLVPTTVACAACTDDSACTAGAAICGSAHTCEACPALDVCPIVTCPTGTTHLTRNGCPVCECAPTKACAGSGDPTCGTATAGAVCYRGAECASGCLPSDSGCCTSECAATGCAAAPTGCAMACGATTSACVDGCIATRCECAGGAWSCTAACADGLTPSCTFTPG